MPSNNLILVRKSDGSRLYVGDLVTTFQGESTTLEGWQPPQHYASTGRVYLGDGRGYYPSVIMAEFISEKE